MAQRQITYSTDARNDIRLIRQYSVEKWDHQQANSYLKSVRETLKTLGSHPELGRAVSPEQPKRRRLTMGRHIIYYRLAESTIEILRIVHERMDASAQID